MANLTTNKTVTNQTVTSRGMSVHALIQLLNRDEEGNPLYQWRDCNRQGEWIDAPQQGGLEQLRQAFPQESTEVCLVLSGTRVVTQPVAVNPAERKHLRRLVPFELEEQVTEELDDLHFAFADHDDNQVAAAYVNNQWLGRQLEELESVGLDVIHCCSLPLLLIRDDNGWTLRLDDLLHVHHGKGLGFSVEPSMATVVLETLLQNSQPPESLRLLAGDEDTLRRLYQLLPPTLCEPLEESAIQWWECNQWDSFDMEHPADLDLRQGGYGRKLPLKRWWQEWRTVAVVGMVALFAYVAVNLAEIQTLKAQRNQLVAEARDVYRQVVPEGQAPDPERQLRNQLAQYQGSDSRASVIDMYGKLAPLITGNKDITLRSLRYSDQPGTMNLMLEAGSYGSVLALQESINGTGLQARLQNTSQQGETQQARMVVSRGEL